MSVEIFNWNFYEFKVLGKKYIIWIQMILLWSDSCVNFIKWKYIYYFVCVVVIFFLLDC